MPEDVLSEGDLNEVAALHAAFWRWAIDILSVLHLRSVAGFQELRTSLQGIASPVLARRLNALERMDLIVKVGAPDDPPSARYALTRKGSLVVRLGEPMFVYRHLAGHQ